MKSKNNPKKKYFCLGFTFIGMALEKHSSKYEFTYGTWFPSSIKGSLDTVLKMYKMRRSGELASYDVVHLSSWESIVSYKKMNPNQIFIAHPHGFIAGINYDRTINDLPFLRRQLHKVMKLFFDRAARKKFVEADIMYVSTPNMLEHAKKIRKDAVWLPNPINTKMLNPNLKKIHLEGSPAVLMPTRMHKYKDPLFGITLFEKIRAKYPKAKLHVVKYPDDDDPLFDDMIKLVPKKNLVIHPRIDRTIVGQYYGSADLMLGQFNENYANFSLVELDGMACGAPLVTFDKYELKREFSDRKKLETLAFRLLEDKKFKKNFIERNLNYVHKVHSEKAVADRLEKDLARIEAQRKLKKR